jgi:hypothetical protein
MLKFKDVVEKGCWREASEGDGVTIERESRSYSDSYETRGWLAVTWRAREVENNSHAFLTRKSVEFSS